MFRHVLLTLRERIRTRHYHITAHADEEMANDDLLAVDLESVILTGEIVERQRDQETGEVKYCVHGNTLDGDAAIVVVKLGPKGKLFFVTIFLE
jgi:hypothetical protein